jgi:hypothetical protein
MTGPRWQLQGDYFENCSCDVVCPCLLSQAQAPPSHGECNGALAFRVESGHLADVRLDGLNAVVLFSAPGPMAQGNWTIGLYVDDRASQPQADALARILSGAEGGPTALIAALAGKSLGMKRVPIAYRSEGRKRSLEIPGVMEMAIEGIQGANGDAAWFDNVVHPVTSRLAAARGTKTHIHDHGFSWDIGGQNAHYAPFTWRA